MNIKKYISWYWWPVLRDDGLWWRGGGFHFENQSLWGFDTNCCTVFGTLNVIELLQGSAGRLEGNAGLSGASEVGINYSDRYTSALTETMGVGGTTADSVCKCVRRYGLLPESRLPWGPEITTRDEYLDRSCITAEMIAEAQTVGRKLNLQYEWIAGGDVSEALRRSPVGAAVSAWFDRGDGIYIRPDGVPVNHFTVIVGETDDYWVALDSYEPYIKHLAKDYRFGKCMVYRITTP